MASLKTITIAEFYILGQRAGKFIQQYWTGFTSICRDFLALEIYSSNPQKNTVISYVINSKPTEVTYVEKGMQKVEIFENQRAAGYDQFVETWIPNYHYFMDIAPRLLRHTSNKDLLVVGCGTGAEIERFVRTPEPWRITGIDPSPEMIAQARENLKEAEHVRLVEGVITDLDTSHLFGAATLLLVLHFMADDGTKLALLKDIAIRLEKDAPFILLDITGDQNQLKANLKILKLLLPAGLEEEDIAHRMTRIEHNLHSISEKRLGELLMEAGFEAPLRFFQNSIYMGWMTKKL